MAQSVSLVYVGCFVHWYKAELIAIQVCGDCGSWIIDATNGDLYGHIVAGHPGSDVVYVIPACRIFDDIAQRTGIAPTIVTTAHLSLHASLQTASGKSAKEPASENASEANRPRIPIQSSDIESSPALTSVTEESQAAKPPQRGHLSRRQSNTAASKELSKTLPRERDTISGSGTGELGLPAQTVVIGVAGGMFTSTNLLFDH